MTPLMVVLQYLVCITKGIVHRMEVISYRVLPILPFGDETFTVIEISSAPFLFASNNRSYLRIKTKKTFDNNI